MHGGGGPKSRSEVLARWNAKAAPVESTSPSYDAAATASPSPLSSSLSSSSSGTATGKGMRFASGIRIGRSTASTRVSQEDSTVADVRWDVCERMDYHVQYAVPATWSMAEAVRENSVSIQCGPPPTRMEGAGAPAEPVLCPAVHGISINCFAYKQRVAHPDNAKLLHIFLKRFNASVGNSLQIVSEYVGQAPGLRRDPSLHGTGGEMADANISETLATRLMSAVAELTFTPGAGQPLVHGLCRAFFSSNARFHYVVVVAVPEDEYAASQDLIVHALMSVVESRVEAAAKQT